MYKLLTIIILVISIGACASSGVIQLSENTYMVSQQSAGGAFTNIGKFQKKVIDQANEFAESQNKTAVGLSLNTRPAEFGKMPSVEYQFKLVEKGSAEARTSTLASAPETLNLNRPETNTVEDDRYERLAKIGELRKNGVLSEEEFQQEKAKILSEQN